MKNITKLSIITGLVIFLVLFGVSQYKTLKVKAPPMYMTIYKSKGGAVMAMGGTGSDKEKIDAFKKSLEENDEFSDCLESSYSYEKKGDYQNAVIEGEKALELAKTKGDHWMVRAGLAELYEKVGKYDLAIKQYDWIIPYQEEALADALKTTYKLEIARREKLVNELKEAQKRVEELKASSLISENSQ